MSTFSGVQSGCHFQHWRDKSDEHSRKFTVDSFMRNGGHDDKLQLRRKHSSVNNSPKQPTVRNKWNIKKTLQSPKHLNWGEFFIAKECVVQNTEDQFLL
jgi:hypothetical protein